MSKQSQMRQEIEEIPEAVARLLDDGGAQIRAAAADLRKTNPRFLVSVARGSSDHAATYLKYISELLVGIPVASVGPSVASVYDRPLKLAESACISISQSGKSPDIVRMTRMAATQGALTLAVTNNADSELSGSSTHALNMHAGQERSVAATKTFVTSLVVVLWLIAEWTENKPVTAALKDLPETLHKAVHVDWSALTDHLVARNARHPGTRPWQP